MVTVISTQQRKRATQILTLKKGKKSSSPFINVEQEINWFGSLESANCFTAIAKYDGRCCDSALTAFLLGSNLHVVSFCSFANIHELSKAVQMDALIKLGLMVITASESGFWTCWDISRLQVWRAQPAHYEKHSPQLPVLSSLSSLSLFIVLPDFHTLTMLFTIP